jgi:hypothetical protein
MFQQMIEIEKEFITSLGLSAPQRQEFAACKLQDVVDAIESIQHEQGTRKRLRNLARIQTFIEAMDDYEKAVDGFFNITIGLGYIWVPILYSIISNCELANIRTLEGSIKFVLQVF